MAFWKANKEYIDELRKVDGKVLYNKPPVRPYYYLKMRINNVEYAIPCSSAKSSVRFNSFTQISVKQKDGKELARLFLINMIPFHEKLFTKVEYREYDINYQRLLAKEERFLNANFAMIANKANNLYSSRYNTSHFKYDMLKQHCCDFKKLEGVKEKMLTQKNNMRFKDKLSVAKEKAEDHNKDLDSKENKSNDLDR